MSIILRNSPLNLQYRICIVTSASSDLGVVICKTLLKANALVLGIDDRKQDHSLSSAPGTHFQFLQCSAGDAAKRVIPTVKEKFEGKERVDVLVCLGSREWEAAVAELVGEVIEGEDGGSVVHVPQGGKGLEVARKLVTSSPARAKVRSNVIVHADVQGKGASQPLPAYEEAKEHMQALIKTEKLPKEVPTASAEAKQEAQKIYDTANLTLFLAGDMSQDTRGQVVYADGTIDEP